MIRLVTILSVVVIVLILVTVAILAASHFLFANPQQLTQCSCREADSKLYSMSEDVHVPIGGKESVV